MPRRRFSFPETSFISTPAQIAANRENAQHSTGARTEAGQAAPSQNNFRHGFASKFKVLDWEDQDDFKTTLDNFSAEHQPTTPYEAVLVDKMAQHFWLTQRALILQDQCFNPKLAMQEADRKLALYMRYQVTQERAFGKCADELRKSRDEKRKQELDEAALSQRAEDSRKAFELQKAREEQEARQRATKFARRKCTKRGFGS